MQWAKVFLPPMVVILGKLCLSMVTVDMSLSLFVASVKEVDRQVVLKLVVSLPALCHLLRDHVVLPFLLSTMTTHQGHVANSPMEVVVAMPTNSKLLQIVSHHVLHQV